MQVGKRDEMEPRIVSDSPRLTSLPFFYSAPLALIVAGILMTAWGDSLVMSPWSPRTLALTHVMTLGFLSMTAFGTFYLLASHVGVAGLARHRLSHLVYYALVGTWLGLVWGIARGESTPVFAAIGLAAVMALVFVIQTGVALKRGPRGGPVLRGLRLTLWGFALTSFLGMWLAHGHGGMRFPGLRGLWMQVHLTIALVGWLGGLSAIGIWFALAPGDSGDEFESKPVEWVIRATAVGIGLPFSLLFAGYIFLTPESEEWLVPFAAAATLPAVIAIWLVHPLFCLGLLSKRPAFPGRIFWQLGLGLGPVTLALGLGAWLLSDARIGLLFGWTALLGWAGTLFYVLLVSLVPTLLPGLNNRGPAGLSPEKLLRGLLLHGGTLILGGVGVVLESDSWIRIAGLCLIANGSYLLGSVITVLRGSRPAPDAPATP